MFIRTATRSAIAIAASVLLVACSVPSAHHVGSSAGGVFFNVPQNWSKVDDRLVAKAQEGWSESEAGAAILDSTVWFEVWRYSDSVSVNQALSNNVVESPVVIASVRNLLDLEKTQLTADIKNDLQDLVLPVSDAVDGDGLEVKANDRFSFSGYEGLQQTLSWDADGKTQTFRIVSLLNPARTRLISFIARCSDTCFTTHSAEIETIIKSITLKEPANVSSP
ncbi:MAG: hypothetical protein RIS75_430 [Actinomycetota bacterium]|jgi:hypothetical protein